MLHEIELVEGPFDFMGDSLFYFDGQSGKLAAGLLPPDPKGYSWFCFETPLAQGCVELMKLGFTAQQIEAAIEANTDRLIRQAELRYEADLTDWSEGRNR